MCIIFNLTKGGFPLYTTEIIGEFGGERDNFFLSIGLENEFKNKMADWEGRIEQTDDMLLLIIEF